MKQAIRLIKMKLFYKNLHFIISDNTINGTSVWKLALVITLLLTIVFSTGFAIGYERRAQHSLYQPITKGFPLEDNEELIIKIIEVPETIKYTDMIILLDEREKVVFDFLANKYAKLYDFPTWLPYLFASIESDFSLRAVNQNSGAIGIFQIMPICLEEYNAYHQKKFTMHELINLETSFEVAMWYINRLKTHYKVPFNEENPYYLYTAYNMGPFNYHKANWMGNTTEGRFNDKMEQIAVAYEQ
jgi:hypothetical protein